VVAASAPQGHQPRPAPSVLRPLSWVGLRKAPPHQVPVALLAMFVLIILTLCIAAAATRFSRRLR
jgi:hypothetical protein